MVVVGPGQDPSLALRDDISHFSKLKGQVYSNDRGNPLRLGSLLAGYGDYSFRVQAVLAGVVGSVQADIGETGVEQVGLQLLA